MQQPLLLASLVLAAALVRAAPGVGSNNHGGSNGGGAPPAAAHRGQFGYTRVSEWKSEFPICSGSRQSPINIELQDIKAVERPALGHFGYDYRPLKMLVVNNGHTVQLTGEWPVPNTPTVFGGPLTGLYEFSQAHFHWGTDNDAGSEHTVANHSYPLEMHMVHWKKIYQNMSEAVKHDDGIAVIGYLLSLDKNSNKGIERIVPAFQKIMEPNQSVQIDPFPLSLFDSNLLAKGYITYLGSLTTPPCSESVIWLLSVNPKKITFDELDRFRMLHLVNNDDHNHRPTQPLNGRSYYLPILGIDK